MDKATVAHNTFVIERNYPVPPECAFAAFANPAKKRRWFAEGEESKVESFEMDFRVGGRETTKFSFGNHPTCTNDTVFLKITTNRLIVLAYTMTMGDHCFSSSQATFEFVPTGKGTNLILTEQAAFFENADGPKIREDGWRQLLEQLAKDLAA